MNERTRERLKSAAERWRVRIAAEPIPTASGCVGFGWRGGRGVAIKIVAPGSEEARGVAALAHFGGHGSVPLLDRADDAVLLPRLQPGSPLSDLVRLGRDDEATERLCAVAARLHGVPLPVGGFPAGSFPLVENWGRAFDGYRAAGARLLPARLVDRAAATFAELAASQPPGERRLLHGDLHHDNVLLDHRRGWLAIDPKGVLGEAAYELGAALRNPAFVPTPALTDRRSRIVAERLGVDRARVLGWAFAQAVLAGVWAWEDGSSDVDFAVVAAEAIGRVR